MRIPFVSDIEVVGEHCAQFRVITLDLHKGRGPCRIGTLAGTGGLFRRGGFLVGSGLCHPDWRHQKGNEQERVN